MYQKLILIGRATADAKVIKVEGKDMEFVAFGVAVDEGKGATFFDIVLFGKRRTAVAEFVKKGRLIGVEGKLERQEKGYFNVVASRIVFLDSLPKLIAEEARSKVKKTKK